MLAYQYTRCCVLKKRSLRLSKCLGLKFINSLAVCLVISPLPLAQHFLHTFRSTVSSFKYQHLVFSLLSSSCCLRLLPAIYLSSNNLFHNSVPTQAVTNPVSLPSFYCMYDIPLPLDSMQSIYPCMALQPLLGPGLPQKTPPFYSVFSSSPQSSHF